MRHRKVRRRKRKEESRGKERKRRGRGKGVRRLEKEGGKAGRPGRREEEGGAESEVRVKQVTNHYSYLLPRNNSEEGSLAPEISQFLWPPLEMRRCLH